MPTTSRAQTQGRVPVRADVAGFAGVSNQTVSRVVNDHPDVRPATRHLRDLGHRTVHHVCGPASWPHMNERAAGWRRALAGHRVEAPALVRVPDLSARAGYAAGREAGSAILGRTAAITAILCAGDTLALGVIRALQDARPKVPEDVSIVGFDDIPEAACIGPPLTTVREEYRVLGRRAFAMLLELVEPRTEAQASSPRDQPRTAPRLDLVVRDSTAPPPRRKVTR